jgi:hypothetical protein
MIRLLKVFAGMLTFVAAANSLFGQTPASSNQLPKEYFVFVKRADSLYKIKEFKNSGLAYTAAFKTGGGKGTLEDRYSAARSWTLANIPDSAFFNIFRITRKSVFRDYYRLANEPDFLALHADKRWTELMKELKDFGFNLGFEKDHHAGDPLPIPWFIWGTKDYIIQTDSLVKHIGKYSIRLEPTEDIKENSFGCVARGIPAIYAGKQIEVRAYMKMENISSPIGLLVRIDDSSTKPTQSLAFENMEEEGIHGTKDWTLYSVKVPYPKDGAAIYIGAINSGTGRLWVDDFEVLIDGKPLSEAKLKVK